MFLGSGLIFIGSEPIFLTEKIKILGFIPKILAYEAKRLAS